MPRKNQELTKAQFQLAKRVGLTRAKSAEKAKLAPADLRTIRAMSPTKGAKTRNVFAKLTKAQLNGMRKDGLDTVLPHVKGGVFLRVPKGAERVKVEVKRGEVVTKWKHRGKNYRRVDTPMKPKDWANVDSKAFAVEGKKPKEKLNKITVAVAGYDSTNHYKPSIFSAYLTRDFGPSIRAKRKTAKNHFAVRRLYVQHTGKPKRRTRNRRV